MSSTLQRIAKNISVQFVGHILSRVLSFTLIVILARRLGTQGFGVYSFTLAFTTLFLTIADFGTGPLLPREIAREPEIAPEYLVNVSLMRIIGSCLLLALGIGSAWFLNYPFETVLLVTLIGISKVIGNLGGVAQGILKGFERMEFSQGAMVIERIVTTAVAIGFVWTGFGLLYVGGAFILGAIVQFLFATGSYIYVSQGRGISPIRLDVDIDLWYEIIREGWPFIASSLFVFIYFDIDTIMISMLLGQTEVGWYSASYRLLTVFGFIPGAFMGAVYPVMSRFYESSDGALSVAFNKCLKYLLAMALPLVAGTILVADESVMLIYGPEYTESVGVLQILIFTQLAIFQNQVLTTMISSIDKQIIQPLTTGTLAIANVVMNLILIPSYGIIGAAVATVLTEILGVLLGLYWMYRFYQLPNYEGVVPLIGATILMAGTVYILDQHGFPLSVLVLSGIFTYIIGLVFSGAINSQDIEFVQRLRASQKG